MEAKIFISPQDRNDMPDTFKRRLIILGDFPASGYILSAECISYWEKTLSSFFYLFSRSGENVYQGSYEEDETRYLSNYLSKEVRDV